MLKKSKILGEDDCSTAKMSIGNYILQVVDNLTYLLINKSSFNNKTLKKVVIVTKLIFVFVVFNPVLKYTTSDPMCPSYIDFMTQVKQPDVISLLNFSIFLPHTMEEESP